MVSTDTSEWDFPNRATPIGSPAYYAVRFSPKGQWQRNALLLAWHALIDEIADHPLDPGVARIKLDWWRNEIATLDAGQPRHPLAEALQASGLDRDVIAPMQQLIDAADNAILAGEPQNDSAFAAACRAGNGALFTLLAHAGTGRDHDPGLCVEAGAYCAAVERVRQVAARPERLPPDARQAAIEALDQAQRTARFEALLGQFDPPTTPHQAALPDMARRLTALARAMQRKLRRKRYPVHDTLVDRPPIAHLWTAWRCR